LSVTGEPSSAAKILPENDAIARNAKRGTKKAFTMHLLRQKNRGPKNAGEGGGRPFFCPIIFLSKIGLQESHVT
jgi:hypothetical protein